MINTFREGFIIKANMEGKLNETQKKKHKKVRNGFDSQACHFITTSDMHQKLGTLS